MIALYAGDRHFRAACDRLLRAEGVAVRPSSRQAELAKSLADGAVRVIVVSRDPVDQRTVQQLAGDRVVICEAPGDEAEAVVHRALEALRAL